MPEALYTASFFHCKPFVCDAFDTRSLLYQYTAQGGGGSFKIETHSRGGLLCIYPPIFLSIPKLSIQKLFLFICKYTYLSKNYLSIYSTLSLGYVLRATMACNFYVSSGQMASRPLLHRAYFSTLPIDKALENTMFQTFQAFLAPVSSFFSLFLFPSSTRLFPFLFFISPYYCRKFGF